MDSFWDFFWYIISFFLLMAYLVVLGAFALLAVLVGRLSLRHVRDGSRVLAVIQRGAETSGQTQVRLVVLLLVTLGVAAAAFELDAVLGAFAAGFILRRLLPAGHESLEHKLEGLAFGLLIPIFFITSGMTSTRPPSPPTRLPCGSSFSRSW